MSTLVLGINNIGLGRRVDSGAELTCGKCGEMSQKIGPSDFHLHTEHQPIMQGSRIYAVPYNTIHTTANILCMKRYEASYFM